MFCEKIASLNDDCHDCSDGMPYINNGKQVEAKLTTTKAVTPGQLLI